MKTFVVSLIALLAASVNGVTIPPECRGLGIRITSCTFDSVGVDVDFETTNEPPYVACVFLAEESGFSHMSRVCPIRIKTVNEKHATLAGDFCSRGNAFVQILMPSATNDPMFRVVTQTALDSYYDNLRKRIDFSAVVDDRASWSDADEERDMQIVCDYTWGAFKPGDEEYITVQAKGFKLVPDAPSVPPGYILVADTLDPLVSNKNVRAVLAKDHHYTNRIECVHGAFEELCHPRKKIVIRTALRSEDGIGWWWWSESEVYVLYNPAYPNEDTYFPKRRVSNDTEDHVIGPLDTSIGLGTRILLDERTKTFYGERAYSLFADRSNECILQRPFKAMSSVNGIKYKLDWLGFVRTFSETNAVPGRIYLEGL